MLTGLPEPHLITALLQRAADTAPETPSVRDETGVWTYRELAERSGQIAALLARAGVGTGDRVVVRLPNMREIVALMYATVRIGAVFVPLAPGLGDFQLRRVVADADPSLIVRADEDAADAWKKAPCPVLSCSELFAELGPHLDAPRTAAEGDGLAFLMYTSGSTAAPRGVRCMASRVLFAVEAIQSRLGYTSSDRVLCRVPFSFDYGLYQALLCALSGAELQMTDRADVALLKTIQEWKTTVVPLVPTLASALTLLRRRDSRPDDVRLFTNTGAALSEPMVESLRMRFPRAAVSLMYGMTECKRISVLEPDGDREKPGSAGRPLDGTTVSVVDDSGRPLPTGAVGQFVVQGPHVMDGYWRDPKATAERFRADATSGRTVLHTGDYGYMDDAGHLYIQGRRDDIFKRRDVRANTVEIETAALEIPGVRLAAVFPPKGERDLTVAVTGDRSAEEVLAGLRERLEPAKVPATCRVVAEIPMTANGKIDKAALGESLGFKSS